MGIHSWHKTALLILLLSSAAADAATRVYTKNPATRQGVVTSGSATPPSGYSYQTPAGEAAYYGQQHVDYHTAGNRYQAGDNPSGSSTPKQAVKTNAVARVNKASVASRAKAIMKASPAGVAQMAGTAAVVWAIDQLPGASYDAGTGQLKVTPTVVTSGYYWSSNLWNAPPGYLVTKHGSAQAACDAMWPQAVAPRRMIARQVGSNSNSVDCIRYDPYSNPVEVYAGYSFKQPLNCPNGIDPTKFECHSAPPAAVPFNDQNYDQLESQLSAIPNPEWLRGLLEKTCAGSPSPAACYDQMSSWAPMHGPATQTSQPRTTTKTQTNPDGTTSTTTTSSQDQYSYTYGNNYFDYSTKTTTTTNVNGDVTTVVEDDSQPVGETPVDTENPPEEEQPQEEPDYQFSDTSFPEVEPFYEAQYPDGLSGVWDQAKSDIDSSAFIGFLKSFVPAFSGSCPSFGLDFNISSWANYGHQDFASMCHIFDFIKIIFLVTAAFAARYIMFGG